MDVKVNRLSARVRALMKGRRKIVYMVGTAFLLAAIVLSPACSGTKRKPVEKKSVEELLDDLANEGDDRVRAAAVRQLGITKGQVAVAAMSVALKDPSDRVRVAAAGALGDSKEPNAADPLWRALNDRTQGAVLRLTAARALANLGDARAADPLIQALPNARPEASAALLRLGPRAVPPLVNALRVSASRPYASAVLVSLRSLAVDPLIEMLRNDDNKYARLAAASTLAEIPDDRAEEALDEALKGSGPEMISAVYRFLIRRGRPGTEGVLVSALSAYGQREMAQDFVGSGNAVLKSAGQEWARNKNDLLATRLSDLPQVYWAGADPSVKRIALYHFDGSLLSASGKGPLESAGVSFVPGKWGSALSVGKGGILKYPLKDNLDFREGTIEMWISPRFDGIDPVYKKYNHALLLYPSSTGDQFLVSEGTFAGFYAGSVIRRKFAGTGGGSIAEWKAGTWHHIAFTYSSRAVRQRFYIDGESIAETIGAMPAPDPAAGIVTVGCDPYGNWTGFVIDELLVSGSEKRPEAIRDSFMRKKPFAD